MNELINDEAVNQSKHNLPGELLKIEITNTAAVILLPGQLQASGYYRSLEGTARYAGLLLAPAEGFSQGFFAPWAKKELFAQFVLILGQFWCPVETPIMLSSNLSNCGNNTKKIIKKMLKKI